MHQLVKEKEHMQLVHRMQEETAASALQEKLRSVQGQCQELLDKVGQLGNVNGNELSYIDPRQWSVIFSKRK